jgi:hypothetical protein
MVQIKHLSLAVKQPEKVARILAEMTQGEACHFPAGTTMNGWVCLWSIEKNELIEFLPQGWRMYPADGGARFEDIGITNGYNPTHVQLEVSVTLNHLQTIANKYGCRHGARCGPRRGGPLYEIWLEDDFLIEFVSNEITAEFS